VAAPGSQAILHALPGLFPGAAAACLSPCYGGYREAWGAMADLPEPDGEAADILFVGRPNNPDGRVAEAGPLLALADRLHRRGGALVVDEAFADAHPAASLAGEAGRPGLLVLRSFGKFHGLAGLRLGFALGTPALTERLAARLGPWSVSGPAIAVGAAALGDAGWAAAARERLAADAGRLDQLLLGSGLSVAGGTALFRLAETRDAAALHAHLAGHGIWTRRFDAHPRWLRLGLPGEASAWARLADALDLWRVRQEPGCPASTSAA